MSRPRRIAVLRALGGLGDVLCAVPALKRLRGGEAGAHITYIGLPQVAPVVARYPGLIDRFLAFPGFPGIPEHPFDPATLRAFLAERAGEAPFDLAIQLHGSGGVTNVFTALLGAPAMAGWHVPGTWCPDPRGFALFPDALPEVERWRALMARLGYEREDDTLDFPIADAERSALFDRYPILTRGRYAVLHAGASDPARRWPPAAFAAVADDLARMGLAIVLSGTAAEAPITAAVAAAAATRTIDLAGRTGLGEMAALVERAAMVVTNDTGTAHLAAALRTPSVTIFIASDKARWAAADTRRHVAVGIGIPDVPIGREHLPVAPSYPSIEDVTRAAASLLEYV